MYFSADTFFILKNHGSIKGAILGNAKGGEHSCLLYTSRQRFPVGLAYIKDLDRAKHGDFDFFFLCDDLSEISRNQRIGVLPLIGHITVVLKNIACTYIQFHLVIQKLVVLRKVKLYLLYLLLGTIPAELTAAAEKKV